MCVFILTVYSQINDLNFNTSKACSAGGIINLIKFDLYEEYKDKIRECQCQDEESIVLECLGPIRELMKADVTEKIDDLERNHCKPIKTP